MASEFKRLRKKAKKKGWKVPVDYTFADSVWVQYWSAMEEYEKDPSQGRPVVPHRTGGSQVYR